MNFPEGTFSGSAILRDADDETKIVGDSVAYQISVSYARIPIYEMSTGSTVEQRGNQIITGKLMDSRKMLNLYPLNKTKIMDLGDGWKFKFALHADGTIIQQGGLEFTP